MQSKPDIQVEVAALGDLSREELADQWRKIYGMPPKGVRRELIVRAVAWHLQARCLGDMSAETRRLLRSAISRVESQMLARDRRLDNSKTRERKMFNDNDGHLARGSSDGVAPAPRTERRRLAPGVRLLREWNGTTHVVDVIEGGFVFEANVYSSLTAIAGKITGTHWSGPRFFGL
jgi:hypothetical protein